MNVTVEMVKTTIFQTLYRFRIYSFSLHILIIIRVESFFQQHLKISALFSRDISDKRVSLVCFTFLCHYFSKSTGKTFLIYILDTNIIFSSWINSIRFRFTRTFQAETREKNVKTTVRMIETLNVRMFRTLETDAIADIVSIWELKQSISAKRNCVMLLYQSLYTSYNVAHKLFP